MEPFKNLYNTKSLLGLAVKLEGASPSFDSERFIVLAMKGLKHLEMKERVVQIAEALELTLPGPYLENLNILEATLTDTSEDALSGFILWPYSYYIETRGLECFEESMNALYLLTQKFTSEWGIRPFLERLPEETFKKLRAWVSDPNEHVRRWVSEGTRPNLPWGKKVPNHLERNFELLEALKEDPSEYVRKSVANHLNDISHLDPDRVLETLFRWQTAQTSEMEALIRRALRTLHKKGHPKALALMGFSSQAQIQGSGFRVSPKKVREGNTLEIALQLANLSPQDEKVMVDYIIDFKKQTGSSPKVFKLKTFTLKGNQTQVITKSHRFVAVTTRKHYPGKHKVKMQVNGQIVGETSFELLDSQ